MPIAAQDVSFLHAWQSWEQRRALASVAKLSRRLEQLDGVAVGILDLDLLAARSRLHVVPKMEAGLLQGLDERRKIVDPKHDAVPSAGFLLLAVRHRPRSRRLWAAEQNLRVAERDAGERGKLLVFEREAEMRRVERDRASDVFDLISDAVHALDEGVRSRRASPELSWLFQPQSPSSSPPYLRIGSLIRFTL